MTLDNVEHVNAILNDPAIFPFISAGTTEPLDARSVLENPIHYVLGCDDAVVMFIQIQPGIYDFHTSILPKAQHGSWRLQAGRACFEYMFTATDAYELITRCPVSNNLAHIGANLSGMHLEFSTRPFWPIKDGYESMNIFTLSLPQWAEKISDLSHEGKWLHDKYKSEFERLGMDVKPHPDDFVHDKYSGIAVAMIKSGQLYKGINFYNRYAFVAGYDPIILESENPTILKCADIKMRITDESFEVLPCQQ